MGVCVRDLGRSWRLWIVDRRSSSVARVGSTSSCGGVSCARVVGARALVGLLLLCLVCLPCLPRPAAWTLRWSSPSVGGLRAVSHMCVFLRVAARPIPSIPSGGSAAAAADAAGCLLGAPASRVPRHGPSGTRRSAGRAGRQGAARPRADEARRRRRRRPRVGAGGLAVLLEEHLRAAILSAVAARSRVGGSAAWCLGSKAGLLA